MTRTYNLEVELFAHEMSRQDTKYRLNALISYIEGTIESVYLDGMSEQEQIAYLKDLVSDLKKIKEDA